VFLYFLESFAVFYDFFVNFLWKLHVDYNSAVYGVFAFTEFSATLAFRNIPGVTAAFIDSAIFYVAESFACVLLLLSS
jgi:hypothetical protein